MCTQAKEESEESVLADHKRVISDARRMVCAFTTVYQSAFSAKLLTVYYYIFGLYSCASAYGGGWRDTL